MRENNNSLCKKCGHDNTTILLATKLRGGGGAVKDEKKDTSKEAVKRTP